MRVMMTLPREVEVIRCDGPGCENWCDRPDPTLPRDTSEICNRDYVQHYGAGCGWLAVPQQLSASIPSGNYDSFRARHDIPAHRNFTTGEPAFFCSWNCFAAQVNSRLTSPDTRDAVVTDNPYNITTEFHRLLPRVA